MPVSTVIKLISFQEHYWIKCHRDAVTILLASHFGHAQYHPAISCRHVVLHIRPNFHLSFCVNAEILKHMHSTNILTKIKIQFFLNLLSKLMANDPWKIVAQTCCPLVPLPTSPKFRGEEEEAPSPLIPGVAAAAAVVALLSGDEETSGWYWDNIKKLFLEKIEQFFLSVTIKKSNCLLHLG